jgi:hypothetical protein
MVSNSTGVSLPTSAACIDVPSASEFMLLADEVQAQAARRRGSRDGQSAKANFIDASRRLYVVAESDKYVTAQRNPTSKLRKPRRHKSLRRALTHRQLLEINTIAASTWVERNYGYAMAASFAGHAATSYQTSATMTYVAATVDELAIVVAALTGEPHPLAVRGPEPAGGEDRGRQRRLHRGDQHRHCSGDRRARRGGAYRTSPAGAPPPDGPLPDRRTYVRPL